MPVLGPVVLICHGKITVLVIRQPDQSTKVSAVKISVWRSHTIQSQGYVACASQLMRRVDAKIQALSMEMVW